MPTEIGQHQDTAKVGVYYAAPVDGWSNLATSYWSGYYKTANPWLMEAYEARLKAMDPAVQAGALAAIVKEAGAIADTVRQGEADRLTYKANVDDNSYKAWETMANIDSREAIARGANYTEISKAKLGLQGEREKNAVLPEKAVAAVVPFLGNLKEALRGVDGAVQRGDQAAYVAALTQVQSQYLQALRAARDGGASGPAIAKLSGDLEAEMQSVTHTLTNPDGSPYLDPQTHQPVKAAAVDGAFLQQAKSLAGQEGLPTQWSYGDMDRFKSGSTASNVTPFAGGPTGGGVSMSTGTSTSGPGGAPGVGDDSARRAMSLAERAYDDTLKGFKNPYADAYAGAGQYDPLGKYIPRTRATPNEMADRTAKLIASRGQEVKASARVDAQPAHAQRAARQEARQMDREETLGGKLGKTVLEAAGLQDDELAAGGASGASYEGS